MNSPFPSGFPALSAVLDRPVPGADPLEQPALPGSLPVRPEQPSPCPAPAPLAAAGGAGLGLPCGGGRLHPPPAPGPAEPV